MSETQWTPGQLAAIQNDYDGNILVSASAGSGKTSVLTQRVMRKIKDGVDVDQLLIVTFTNAAAQEMRERINGALQTELNQTQESSAKQHLVRQLRKLTTAHIETMDAFCLWLVKRYYYVINLDPDFRILTDKSERTLLQSEVWDEVREELYGNDRDHRFAQLTRNFSNDRSDDGLTDLVFRLYELANVNQDPEQWIDQLGDFYRTDGALTESRLYRDHLLPDLQNQLEQIQASYQQARELAHRAGIEKVESFLVNEQEQLAAVAGQLASLGWDQLRAVFEDTQNGFKRFPSINKKDFDEEQLDVKEQCKNLRNSAKKQIEEISKNYFWTDEASLQQLNDDAAQLIQKLIEVVKQFSTEYAQVKRQRHAYDFTDIEHFSFQILNDQSEVGTALRTQLQQQFNEIMVDEYQDNNHLQDAILGTIKNPERPNLFMVGDVKQSIYRFRLADPQMFMDKYHDYPDSEQNQLITLPDNFRSVANVDYFTNLVFEQIMDRSFGEVDYTGDAQLQFGARDYPADLDTKTELLLLADDQANLNEQDQLTNDQRQIELIANKIETMMNDGFQVYDRKAGAKRPLQYGDIALLSSTKRNNFEIANVFAEHQIPLNSDGSESYFKTTEIQIMLSLLQIIDNPAQDIPLAAVLRSPLVGLDENELAFIRITKKTGNYYQAVLDFRQGYQQQQQTEFGNRVRSKVEQFFDQLTELRDYATKHSLAELIWEIYNQTGFLDYVGGMPAGKKRQANLHALYQRAEEYERNGFQGLFAFVQFIKRLQKDDNDLAEASVDVDPDSVTVKTIHGSKGLEYPVVFLIDANHKANDTELKQSFVVDDQMGLGIKYYYPDRHERVKTLQYVAITNALKRKAQAEEMRKLYVALTRAKQKLIITGIVKGTTKQTAEERTLQTWTQAGQSPNLVINQATRSSATNFLDWMGMALVRHPQFQALLDDDLTLTELQSDPSEFTVEFVHPEELQTTTSAVATATDLDFTGTATDPAEIKHQLEFQYPFADATQTTAYQSVSEIKRQFDDPDNIQLGSVADPEHQVLQRTRYQSEQFAQPQFMQTVAQPTPQEVGTATHLVLQKLDVNQPVDEEHVKALIEQLVEGNLLTATVAKQISRHAIVAFYQTHVGQRILQFPDRLHREVPFSLIIKAQRLFSEFHNDPHQQILVHGIIDGYLDDPDEGPILFDYKTSFVNPADPKSSVEQIKDQYTGQVNLYALALQDILHEPVRQKYLYLLGNQQLVSIDPNEN
ncbi:helicase-exonuclease AddAB subunit AddA [Fructilactobacillus carniphilus]|uniref:ATP-dependent helicase/nuclease subunit A n=1 Tax=Fructilactobacillus carniphilus TaxID=2940297 RepID=A0ABY5BVF3_9LACO|nr:helicase-exonuclease AddAB subunit AddA [Fructilactobacillus carniphilus]USS90469.1 helicase-exonuclease AddAB subunit AddA [Fructilactobacillus carniphilus]